MNSGTLLFSVRRELWENRSIYIAPLIVACVVVIGALIAPLHKFSQSLDIAAGAIMGTTLIVAIFYCLDALYAERRDRSVLFWKSMPVSDLTTVLSKIAIPLVVLPIITFVITIVTQLIMLLTTSAVFLINGRSAATLWTMPWVRMTIGLLLHLWGVHAIAYAPIFGWLLLVSAWAKRLPFLWAFFPPAAIGIVEKLVFGTSRFGSMMAGILTGGDPNKPMSTGGSMFAYFDAGAFLGRPGLYIGLVIAALCVAGAVRLRRDRDPI